MALSIVQCVPQTREITPLFSPAENAAFVCDIALTTILMAGATLTALATFGVNLGALNVLSVANVYGVGGMAGGAFLLIVVDSVVLNLIHAKKLRKEEGKKVRLGRPSFPPPNANFLPKPGIVTQGTALSNISFEDLKKEAADILPFPKKGKVFKTLVKDENFAETYELAENFIHHYENKLSYFPLSAESNEEFGYDDLRGGDSIKTILGETESPFNPYIGSLCDYIHAAGLFHEPSRRDAAVEVMQAFLEELEKVESSLFESLDDPLQASARNTPVLKHVTPETLEDKVKKLLPFPTKALMDVFDQLTTATSLGATRALADNFIDFYEDYQEDESEESSQEDSVEAIVEGMAGAFESYIEKAHKFIYEGDFDQVEERREAAVNAMKEFLIEVDYITEERKKEKERPNGPPRRPVPLPPQSQLKPFLTWELFEEEYNLIHFQFPEDLGAVKLQKIKHDLGKSKEKIEALFQKLKDKVIAFKGGDTSEIKDLADEAAGIVSSLETIFKDDIKKFFPSS